jgi:hypothetical protein
MVTRRSTRALASLSLGFLAFAPSPLAAPGDVHVVSGLGPFTEIQDAVNAASNYDTILVKANVAGPSGGYASFVVSGKTLVVVGENNTPTPVRVRGQIRIEGLPAGALFVLGSIEGFQKPLPGGTGGNALRTFDNDGAIRIEQCEFRGSIGSPTSTELYRCAWIGVDADTQFLSTDVVAASGPAGETGAWSGGVGIFSTAPALRFYDCAIVGGHGGNSVSGDSDVGVPDGGPGGDAIRASEGLIFAAGSAIAGGTGGNGDWVFCPEWGPGGNGGDGGRGLLVGETSAPSGISSQVFALSTLIQGGTGGAGNGGCPPGVAGDPGLPVQVQASGAFQQFSNGQARYLTGTPLVRENASIALSAIGANADRAYVRIEEVRPGSSIPPAPGASHAPLGAQPKARLLFLGTIPASGTLAATIPAGTLAAGVESKWLRLHATFVLSSGVVVEGNDFVVAVIDPAF